MALASNGTVWAWGYNEDGELGNGTYTGSNIPVQVSLPSGVTITNIAAGDYHSLAMASNGMVWAWGNNNSGELGNGTNTSSNIPVQVSLPSGVVVKVIAAGYQHSLALVASEAASPAGTVWAWGSNGHDELGNGTNTPSNIPVQVSLPSGVTITNIAGGGDFSLALASDGTVWDWGDNSYGELGNGTNDESDMPVQVPLNSYYPISDIAAGENFSLALATDGAVWAWGNNNSGELGNGTNNESDTPVQVGLSNDFPISNIAAGENFGLALGFNGTVWAWGDNSLGQLGNGTNNDSNYPVQVSLPSLPSGVTITNIAAGGEQSLALASNGTVWAWGNNNSGELGNGTNTPSNIPVQVSLPSGVTITNITAGEDFSLALASNGTVWAWGYNGDGELGNGTNTNSNIPVQVSLPSLPSGVTITNIAAGEDFSLAIASNGTLWAWGDDYYGELGNGTYAFYCNIPVQVSLPSGVEVKDIAAGDAHSLALVASEATPPAGTVWAWGLNNYGQLGNGTYTDTNIPVPVSLPSGVTITNLAGGGFNSLALASNGTVWAWGDNLGNGTNTPSNIPVQVSLPSGVTITNIAAGGDDNLALASNGTVWAWGWGVLGGTNTDIDIPVQVSLPSGVTITNIAADNLALASNGTVWAWGDNTLNIPVQVSLPSGVTITNISGGGDFSLALASNGKVWAWGDNIYGQLGNGTNADSNIPVQVSLPSGVTITNIAAGEDFSLALASNGTVWAWGDNGDGELGNGTNKYDSDIPVQVSLPSGATITNIAAGEDFSLALASNGTVWGWGLYGDGDLGGNGTTYWSNIPVQVSLPSGVVVKDIAAGYYHSLALVASATPISTTTSIEGGSASVSQNDGVTVSIEGSTAPNGTGVTISSVNYGTIQPSGTGMVQLNGSIQGYDVIVGSASSLGSSAMAKVAISSPSVTTNSIMQYFYNGKWNNATNISISGSTISGDIPVSALGGTPIAIGIAMVAPTITNISPSSGPTAGGTSVTITGTDFVSGATVAIGGVAATGVTFVSSASITAVTPAGTAGAQNVAVTNPDSQFATLTGGFTYGSVVDGTTYEANGVILGGVTLTLDGTTHVTSAADGTYQLIAATTGSHTIVATQTGYRSQTQTVNVTDLTATYPLDFKGDNGLVPDAPNVSFVLACINKWKYPPSDGTGLGISKVLSVINAWKFPIN